MNADAHQDGGVLSPLSPNYYCPIRLANGFVKKGTVFVDSSTHFFNWQALGYDCGVCFSSVPPNVSFLLGPLCAEYTTKEHESTHTNYVSLKVKEGGGGGGGVHKGEPSSSSVYHREAFILD